MNKLTADKCREMFLNLFENKRQEGITMKEDLYMQSLEIALPILEQQERGESEWIEWRGGQRPVVSKVIVDVKFADGKIITNLTADSWNWLHMCHGRYRDITSYRLVK